jgi:hypothetical protein
MRGYMKDFNWDAFKNDKVAVHCDTLEKAEDFIDRCITHGFVWYGGSKLDINEPLWIDKNMCYSSNHNEVSFSNIKYYKENNCNIIEWKLECMKSKDLNLEQKVEDLEN